MEKLIELYLNEDNGKSSVSNSEIEEYNLLCESFEELRPIYDKSNHYSIFEIYMSNYLKLKKERKKLEEKQAKKKLTEELSLSFKVPKSTIKDLFEKFGI